VTPVVPEGPGRAVLLITPLGQKGARFSPGFVLAAGVRCGTFLTPDPKRAKQFRLNDEEDVGDLLDIVRLCANTLAKVEVVMLSTGPVDDAALAKLVEDLVPNPWKEIP
jgi:hypothetical protein